MSEATGESRKLIVQQNIEMRSDPQWQAHIAEMDDRGEELNRSLEIMATTMAFTPNCINSSIPSGKGKKASEAATEFFIFSGGINCNALIDAILQLSSLLGCPEPIPKVDLLLAITMALDFTYLQTLNAKIKFFNCVKVGFLFETTTKFFLPNFIISGD